MEKTLGDRIDFVDPAEGDKLLGAFRAVCGIRGVVVLIHAPVGCHWGVNYIERLSSIKTNATISALRERSVIFGGEENLRRTIEIIFKRRRRRYLILLSGSVPTVIGEDCRGTVGCLDFPINFINIDCGGYLGKMGDGFEEALCALFEWIEDPDPKIRGRVLSVNLIGLQRDIVKGRAGVEEIKRMLALLGIRVNAVFPPSTLSEIRRGSNARLNIVFGYGKGLAERMKQRWETPYIYFDAYPYGTFGVDELVEAVMNGLKIDVVRKNKIEREKEKVLRIIKKAHLYLPSLYGLGVAISGDLPQVKGMSRFLQRELGMEIQLLNITSAPPSIGALNLNNFSASNIFIQDSWHRFASKLRAENIGLIFGTDLERRISSELGIPLILWSFPTISRIDLTSNPYLGLRGVIGLVEEIVNSLLNYG